MRNVFFFLLPFALFLSACQPTRPIRELRIVETVGCDLTPDGAAMSIFAPEPAMTLRQEAASLRLAMDRLQSKAASGALFFAHTAYLLIGQGMAAADLAPALDLVARSQDMRLRTPLFLVQGGDAADAMETGGKNRTVTQMLSALQEDTAAHGAIHAFSCGEILQSLAEGGAALAAACRAEQDALVPCGYGVLKDGACVGWLDAKTAQAAQLLMNLGGQQDLRLEDVTLTIEQSRSVLRPEWTDGALSSLTIELRIKAALAETNGQPDAAADRAALETALAETVAERCAAAVRQCQTLRADALGLGGRLKEAHPGRWAKIEPDWARSFPALPIRISVFAALDRTQDLTDPLPLGGAR